MDIVLIHFNQKYSDAIRCRIIQYFRTHTARETAAQFRLSHGQVVGILETCRRKGIIGRAFKDKRTKRPWTLEDWLFMVRRAGVRQRAFIGKKLKRGGARVVRERLRKDCGRSGTKFLNGMPLEWAMAFWGKDSVPNKIKTDAGPPGDGIRDFYFILVPWAECERLSKAHKTDATVKIAVRAMAKFQHWIHGTRSIKGINKKLEAILRER